MLSETLRWWLAVEAIGLVVLPIVLIVFQRLPGRGYAFTKPAALLLAGYVYWLALSMHLLPNRPGSIVWALLPLAVASALIVRSRWRELLEFAEKNLAYIVAVEALFFVALLVASYLKSYIPEIAGTEKPMDFMMLNSASRSQHFPPDDPWLAGAGVSYYYFGYVIQAMLGKLAAVPTAVAFNLGLASTAALAVTAAFGLGYEVARLVRRVRFEAAALGGLVAVLLLALIGNLEGVLEFGVANGYVGKAVVDAVDINDLEMARQSSDCLLTLAGGCIEYPSDQSSFWWWWRATRLSPDGYSITEFPFFSFLLGDLHPHVMAIPFVLTAFGLGLAFWTAAARLNLDFWQQRPWLLLVSALLLGGLGFLNTWDLPTFGFLLVALVAARNLLSLREPKQALVSTLGFVAPLALLAVMLYAPFYFSFSSQASGLDTVRNGATRPLHSALFWAPLVVANLPLPLVLLSRGGFKLLRGDFLVATGVPCLLLLFWALLVAAGHGGAALPDAIADRGYNWFTALFLAAGLAAALLALRRLLAPPGHEPPLSDSAPGLEDGAQPTPSGVGQGTDDDGALVPVLVAMATAFLLVIGAELFYVQDVFASRLNTVFKLSYQAWLLLAISGGYSLWWLARMWQPSPDYGARLVRGAWGTIAILVMLGALLYPLGATLARTRGFGKEGRSLDGLAVARVAQRSDFVAIEWLRDRAGPSERIVEGMGGQYSSAGRVSAWSGVPTVLGWLGHELQWGRDERLLSQRQTDVDAVYSSESLEDALTILQKYGVTYVFVGSIEREKYPEAGLAKFASGLPLAVQAGDTFIYRVPRPAPDSNAAKVP